MAYKYESNHDSPNFTPNAKVPAVYGMKRTIAGITIHHWGVTGQKFDNIRDFLCRKGGNTSAHYVVEAGRVACIVNPKDAAWHAGSARGNATTVGIECRPEMSSADLETVAELIAELRDVYGDIPLYPHKHWKNTACPGKYEAKLSWLDKRANELRKGSTPAKTTTSKPSLKSTTTIAKEVIAGKWGSGVDRVSRLKKAGYNPTAVQAAVNKALR